MYSLAACLSAYCILFDHVMSHIQVSSWFPLCRSCSWQLPTSIALQSASSLSVLSASPTRSVTRCAQRASLLSGISLSSHFHLHSSIILPPIHAHIHACLILSPIHVNFHVCLSLPLFSSFQAARGTHRAKCPPTRKCTTRTVRLTPWAGRSSARAGWSLPRARACLSKSA